MFKAKFLLIFIFLGFFMPRAASQVSVDITMPDLGDGMSALESIMAVNVASAVSEIANLVGDTLDKPLLTEAFGTAAAMTSGMAVEAVKSWGSPSLFLGLGAAYASDTFDPQTQVERFEQLQADDDFYIGVGMEAVSFGATVPLDFLLPRFSAAFNTAYLNVITDEIVLRDFSIQAGVQYAPFNSMEGQLWKWNPLTIKLSGGYTYNHIGVLISAGVIEQSFSIDPDGAGPLFAQSVTIQLDPVIDLALESRVGNISPSLSTGLKFLDFFHVQLGGGCRFLFGQTDVSVSSDADIEVLGYLDDLIESDGSVSISGSVSGSSPDLLLPFFFGGVQFNFSRVFLSLSAAYYPSYKAAVQFSMGASL